MRRYRARVFFAYTVTSSVAAKAQRAMAREEPPVGYKEVMCAALVAVAVELRPFLKRHCVYTDCKGPCSSDASKSIRLNLSKCRACSKEACRIQERSRSKHGFDKKHGEPRRFNSSHKICNYSLKGLNFKS